MRIFPDESMEEKYLKGQDIFKAKKLYPSLGRLHAAEWNLGISNTFNEYDLITDKTFKPNQCISTANVDADASSSQTTRNSSELTPSQYSKMNQRTMAFNRQAATFQKHSLSQVRLPSIRVLPTCLRLTLPRHNIPNQQIPQYQSGLIHCVYQA